MPEFEHWCLPEFSMQKFSLFDDPGGRNFATGLPFTWQLHNLHCRFFDFWKYLKEAQTPPSMVMSKSGTRCTPSPALLQDPWTKKLRSVFPGREWHQVPHKVHVCHCNSAMNALEDGFGHARTRNAGFTAI